MQHVLIASPVKQRPAILQEFLACLQRLNRDGLLLDYVFVDDNAEESPLLQRFASENAGVRIIKGEEKASIYHCNEHTHHWQEDVMWRVARYKDLFINIAREKEYDYLLLVDSDLALNPKTITHLVDLGKDIISEVFWTKWEQELVPLPQVWLGGQYRLHEAKRGEALTDEIVGRRQREFIEQLKCPGTYKVGGLGACTLISKQALRSGVSFHEIYNLDLIGEDRHFCVRAAVLGFDLYADTCYPPYHMYRESELPGLARHKELYNYDGARPEPKLTLAMLVRNEADRYLKQVLGHAVQYVDQVVILDDASEDNTVELCQTYLNSIPHRVSINPQPGFHNEITLRKQLWDMAVATNPDWILILDADELFEARAMHELRPLLASPEVDVYTFRLYDMWTEDQYREDTYWQAHRFFRPFLVRYKPGFPCVWHEVAQHCGRFPVNIAELNVAKSILRVKHFGWVRPEDRLNKFYRYRRLDPDGRYGIKEQYDSILDPKPKLVPWGGSGLDQLKLNIEV